MKLLAPNMIQRLWTQTQSADTLALLTAPADNVRKTLLLGIHVSALQAPRPELPVLADSKQMAGSLLVSIVAKWSGSDGFHKVRTFLQKSFKCTEDRPYTFLGALAIAAQGQNAICKVVDTASLAASTIIVLRAGVAAVEGQPKEEVEVEAVLRRERRKKQHRGPNQRRPHQRRLQFGKAPH